MDKKILITNDDGIDADGIVRLAAAAKNTAKYGSLLPNRRGAPLPTV